MRTCKDIRKNLKLPKCFFFYKYLLLVSKKAEGDGFRSKYDLHVFHQLVYFKNPRPKVSTTKKLAIIFFCDISSSSNIKLVKRETLWESIKSLEKLF